MKASTLSIPIRKWTRDFTNNERFPWFFHCFFSPGLYDLAAVTYSSRHQKCSELKASKCFLEAQPWLSLNIQRWQNRCWYVLSILPVKHTKIIYSYNILYEKHHAPWCLFGTLCSLSGPFLNETLQKSKAPNSRPTYVCESFQSLLPRRGLPAFFAESSYANYGPILQ